MTPEQQRVVDAYREDEAAIEAILKVIDARWLAWGAIDHPHAAAWAQLRTRWTELLSKIRAALTAIENIRRALSGEEGAS